MSDTEELKPCPYCKHGSVPGDPEGAPVEDCLRCDGTGMLASLPVRLRKSVRGDRPLFYEAAAEIERLTAELAAARPPPGVETEGVEAAQRLLALAAGATPGPWIDPPGRGGSDNGPYLSTPAGRHIGRFDYADNHPADKRFIAACRADVETVARALLSTSSRGGEDGTSLAMTPASLPASNGIPSEWRPIESAPKDGTHILVWEVDDRAAGVMIGLWEPGTGWMNEPGGWPMEATHWMPLPSAPIGSAPPSNEGGSMNPVSSNPLPQDAGELVEAKTSPLLYEVINRHRPAPNKGEG